MVIVKIKYYDNRYPNYNNKITAIVSWDLIFMKKIKENFGIDGYFSSPDLKTLFNDVADYNSIRQKLIRQYKKGLFVRKKVTKEIIGNKKNCGRLTYYVYAFSNYAKERLENIDNFSERKIDETYSKIIKAINERGLVYI